MLSSVQAALLLAPSQHYANTHNTHIQHTKHTQALTLFDDLLASNLAPNQATFNALAAAHARAGDWGRAGEVLRHMGRCACDLICFYCSKGCFIA